MGWEVDLRYCLGRWRILRMARPTKTPVDRFGRAVGPRVDLVLVGRFVTQRARHRRVVRDCLLTRDLTVTCPTLLGHDWWLGCVGIMTSHARRQWVVRHRIDLREARWPRRIVRVAERAEAPLAWRCGLGIHRRRRVPQRGPVTDLTGDAAVVPCRPLFGYRTVAQRTFLVASVFFGMRLDRIQG